MCLPIQDGLTLDLPMQDGLTLDLPIQDGWTLDLAIQDGLTLDLPIQDGLTLDPSSAQLWQNFATVATHLKHHNAGSPHLKMPPVFWLLYTHWL